jgi:hypothetical protein
MDRDQRPLDHAHSDRGRRQRVSRNFIIDDSLHPADLIRYEFGQQSFPGGVRGATAVQAAHAAGLESTDGS